MFQIIGCELEICKACDGAKGSIVEFNATTPVGGHAGCAVAPQVLSFLKFFDAYDINSLTLEKL